VVVEMLSALDTISVMATYLHSLFSLDQLEKAVRDGLVTRRYHNSTELELYTYTSKTQYQFLWDEVTTQTRGLIVDRDGLVIARPFPKFFEAGSTPKATVHPPDEPFELFDKIDGSLGILYKTPNHSGIATKGSFHSPQAEWATLWWNHHYPHFEVPDGVTLLFEIVTPWNRVIVDYGDFEGLVLLAAINNATGKDVPLPKNWDGPVVKRYGTFTAQTNPLDVLITQPWNNREGYVVRYKNSGVRVKYKYREYVDIHSYVTQTNTLTIWKHLADQQPLDLLLDYLPDETYEWVKHVVAEIEHHFNMIIAETEHNYQQLPTDTTDRKTLASHVKQTRYPHLLFAKIDNKPVEPLVWALVKPAYSTPDEPEPISFPNLR